MGWAAGSQLGQEIWDNVREYIPENKRKEVATLIYDAVCDLDADDWDGTSQLEIDADVEVYCWNCDDSFPASELNEEHLCKNCAKELA